jgi:hypothetical protein
MQSGHCLICNDTPTGGPLPPCEPRGRIVGEQPISVEPTALSSISSKAPPSLDLYRQVRAVIVWPEA